MEYNVLDLFSGAGGLSYGLEQSGMKTLIAVDSNISALQTFSQNFPNSICLNGDITKKEFKTEIVKIAKEKKVNVICGGPPCQGFSLKGKNLGLEDKRNFLFKEFIYLVSKINPEIVIIENVKNILNSGAGFFKNEIIKSLEKMGYFVNYKTLNAKYYGVPQNRERAFFLASKSKMLSFPNEINEIVTVRDAISDLAYHNSGEGKINDSYKNKSLSEYQKKLRGSNLQYHVASSHSKEALYKLSLIKPECGKECLPKNLIGKQKFSTTWSRLIWDEVSPTIDTRFDTPSNGRNSHPFLHRAITPREAARIQSFSDNFIFHGNKCEVCKQIGNAVPPLLAKEIGSSIIKQYSEFESLSSKNYNIFNADANNIIHEFLKDGVKVDHIITDPPYCISKDNNLMTLTNSKRKGVNFGRWDTNFNVLGWIKDFSKLIKENGSFIIFCSYKYISYIIDELEANDFETKDILIWKKKNPMPRNVNRRYVQDTEYAVWAVRKKSKWIFNKDNKKSYMRAFFETPVVSGNERLNHPTQKSLDLMKQIISIHTNKGQVVLDPFMGTGTTGSACLLLGRKFIGIENNKKYYKISKTRLNKI